MIARKRREAHLRSMEGYGEYRRAYGAARYMAKTKSPERTCATWKRHMLEFLQ